MPLTRGPRIASLASVQLLPIDPLLPEIVATLRVSSRLVLRADPGAGKTTRVPAALLDAGLAGDKQVVVLEPRRIAARAAAEFVARERGGGVGGEIGYRVRFEQRGGAQTRLWFLTEGVLGRQLVRDPFLEAAGIVVLDEFHERHLPGDVALAVVRELQDTVRPDLKLVVMSATLETDRLATYLGGCPVLTSQGRVYPVAIEYAAELDDRPLAGRVASAVRRVLADPEDRGDVLVFLPGAAEIRRARDALEPIAASRRVDVVPLHGDLPLGAQQRAITRGPRRKIVLATNVAETSLTIDGVTAVIDSGLARTARFDARHGINTMRVGPISRASADQRAGRAGRTAAGRCLRLWTEAEHGGRRAHETPEVLRLDLAGTLLELRAWGLRDLRRFAWLDAPSEATVQRAEHLLRLLGAVDETGAVTPIGLRMLRLAVEPRLARVLIEAEQRGCVADGALIAALASERDIRVASRSFAGSGVPHRGPATSGSSDLVECADLFRQAARAQFDADACLTLGLDARGVRSVDRTRRHLGRAQRAAPHPNRSQEEDVLRCILAGFPDRVVRRRAPNSARGVMVGGGGVMLADASVVRTAEYFVAVDVEGGRQGGESLVRMASAIDPRWLGDMYSDAMRDEDALIFDAERERIVRRMRVLFHDLVLDERTDFDVDPLAAGEILAGPARRNPHAVVPMSDAVDALLGRIRFLAQALPELGFPTDPAVLFAAAVASLCAGKRSIAEVRAANMVEAVRAQLTAPQRHALDREAPTQYRLPSGRLAPVRYDRDKPPAVSARIQELFGLRATPRCASGRVPLVIELLAPNQRPVQITDDLESFWRTTYAEVRKQLRGRYPKHAWPDDPLTAVPTTRARRG